MPPADQLIPALLLAALVSVAIVAVLRLLESVAKYLVPLAAVLYLVFGDHSFLETLGAAVVGFVEKLVHEQVPELPLVTVTATKTPNAAKTMHNSELIPGPYGLEITRTGIEVFAAHAVLGAASVAVLYLVMETWYPAVIVALPGLPALVAWGEAWLWFEASTYLPLYVYNPQAALAGAVVGALVMVAVGEPSLQKRDRNERSNSGILEEL